MTTTEVPTSTKGRQRSIPILLVDILATAMLGLGLVGYTIHNLGNRYFWTDESSTFFTALSWPAPGQPPGDIADAWSVTTTAFLDPGLFHMIVRYWAAVVGTGIETLRFLPFVFFLIYLVSVFCLIRLVGAPWFLAVGGLAVMMVENITPYYAVELRPYSAGLAASVALPLLALLLIRATTIPRLVLFLVGVVTVGSMQYNTLPIALAVVAILAIAWIQTDERTARIRLTIAAVAALLWLPAFYLISRGNPLAASGGDSLDYISTLVLSDMPMSQALHVIFTNFFSATALPRTLFIVLIPLLWWRRWLPPVTSHADAAARLINLLWVFVVTATLATFCFAMLGFLPWILGTRWSIADVGLIAVSLAGLLGVLMRTNWAAHKTAVVIVAVAAVGLSAVGGYRLWTYERQNNLDYMRYLAPAMLSGAPGKGVVDYWIHPDARYWIEYSGEYPDLRRDWITAQIESTPGFKAAAAEDIERFLSSEDDRMLLRSRQALTDSGVALPPNVTVVEVPADALNGAAPQDAPILLVKGS